MEKWLTHAFLTLWVKDASQEDFLRKLQMLEPLNICIGAIEKTQNELEHYHVIVKFKRSVRFETLKNLSNSMHIESVKSSGSLAYTLKEGCYYNDFELEINNDNNLYTALINDMMLLTWKEILKKYPKLIIGNYSNIKHMYDDLNENI